MAGMSYNMKLSFNDASEVRTALTARVIQLKAFAGMRRATEEERINAMRSINTLERILRTEYGDYDEDETAPAIIEPMDIGANNS